MSISLKEKRLCKRRRRNKGKTFYRKTNEYVFYFITRRTQLVETKLFEFLARDGIHLSTLNLTRTLSIPTVKHI